MVVSEFGVLLARVLSGERLMPVKWGDRVLCTPGFFSFAAMLFTTRDAREAWLSLAMCVVSFPGLVIVWSREAR